MRSINPRRFNKYVTVQKLTDTKDSTTGEFTETATTLCNRYASVEPLSGRELIQAMGVEADVTHKVSMAWDPLTATIIPKYRVRLVSTLGTRYFNILAVRSVEERNRLLEFTCKEQVGQN